MICIMDNEFLKHGKKKYSEVELINGIGPFLMVDKYWQDTTVLGDTPVIGKPLFNSKKEHIGKLIKLNKSKSKFVIKLFKPVSLLILFSIGINLSDIIFDLD